MCSILIFGYFSQRSRLLRKVLLKAMAIFVMWLFIGCVWWAIVINTEFEPVANTTYVEPSLNKVSHALLGVPGYTLK